MTFCQNCGKELAEDAKFCAGCGTPVGAKEEDGSKRTQKFLGGGVQYKCPSCGAMLSKLTTKCPECGAAVEFKDNATQLKDFFAQVKKTNDVDSDIYICDLINTYEFPLDAQSMLELALFAKSKVFHPVDVVDSMTKQAIIKSIKDGYLESDTESILCERVAWCGLLDRIYEKILLLYPNSDIKGKVESLRTEANKELEEIKSLCEKVDNAEKKSKVKSKIKWWIFWLIVVGIIVYFKFFKK
ncbi:MAG: zinc ribbon domain-containing protein [Treponema sp.]|nr:zinc ribbon domain-containing protein [Treponema sp.]